MIQVFDTVSLHWSSSALRTCQLYKECMNKNASLAQVNMATIREETLSPVVLRSGVAKTSK